MDKRILDIQGWMSEEELEFLYELVRASHESALVVELGAWKGRSTAALYTAMHGHQTVVTVDTWLGQPDLRFGSHREVLEADLFLEFMKNMRDLGIEPLWYKPGGEGARYLRMDSLDASLLFEDGSLDAVIIDCDHTKVGADIDAWRCNVKPQGTICGHDYAWEGVKEGVLARFPISQVVGDLWVGNWGLEA